MKIGTRSCLYGYHTFWLHGWFVARGWFRLHGFRRTRIGTRGIVIDLPNNVRHTIVSRAVFTSLGDPRLWLAFFLHDIGYFGKPNMDGAEGERHPETGARIMAKLFGKVWGDFCLYHSRFYAKKEGAPVSVLCYADKLAITFYPEWLMVRLVSWTGEAEEYMKDSKRQNEMEGAVSVLEWFRGVKVYVTEWVETHKDGREDTWTPDLGYGSNERPTVGDNGVWK